MTIRKIARMGHPVLGQKAEAVTDLADPELRRLVEDMVETMIDANGAGLAAPQVHESIRLVIFQALAHRADPGLSEAEAYDHTAPLTVLVNPVIEILSSEKEGGWEGCLSVPGLRGWVERPAHIRYQGGWVSTANRSNGSPKASMPAWSSTNATILMVCFTRNA
jgi:peptide deformylase